MSHKNKLLKDKPDADEALIGIADELDEKHSLAVLAESEGGKLLITATLKDIATTVSALSTQYKEATHTDLIVLCAELDKNLALHHTLKRAKKHKEELEEVLKEALTE